MSALESSLADYLRIRRALGYKLERAEKLLAQYLEHLDRLGQDRVTVENALGWVTIPAAGSGSWWAFRLSAVRGFASYLHGLDPAHQIPPADLLPHRPRRAVPYLYSDQQIGALRPDLPGEREQLPRRFEVPREEDNAPRRRMPQPLL